MKQGISTAQLKELERDQIEKIGDWLYQKAIRGNKKILMWAHRSDLKDSSIASAMDIGGMIEFIINHGKSVKTFSFAVPGEGEFSTVTFHVEGEPYTDSNLDDLADGLWSVVKHILNEING